MKNKKIAVYYIATDVYKSLFNDFLESLQNFFPDCKKIVKVISDDLEEYKDYEKGNVKVLICPRINHYPWPIITLYKMWHILQNFDDSADYACYFNANSIIYPHNENIFDTSKITVSYHSFNREENSYNPWPYIIINKNSSAYLVNETYEYIQGGFFFGPNQLIKEMCKDVVLLVKSDTSRGIFATWHDESYLNKWCVDNYTKVDKKYIMSAYKEYVTRDRFVYLRNKKETNIDKREIMSSNTLK